jgi:hypothetical protein
MVMEINGLCALLLTLITSGQFSGACPEKGHVSLMDSGQRVASTASGNHSPVPSRLGFWRVKCGYDLT